MREHNGERIEFYLIKKLCWLWYNVNTNKQIQIFMFRVSSLFVIVKFFSEQRKPFLNKFSFWFYFSDQISFKFALSLSTFITIFLISSKRHSSTNAYLSNNSLPWSDWSQHFITCLISSSHSNNLTIHLLLLSDLFLKFIHSFLSFFFLNLRLSFCDQAFIRCFVSICFLKSWRLIIIFRFFVLRKWR